MKRLAYMRQWAYRPRPISKETLRGLIEGLSVLKTSLPTESRAIRARAIGKDAHHTDLTGKESWKVIEPYSFSELEEVHFALQMNKTQQESCEIYVELRKERILLSVSDLGTEWGGSVFEEMQNLLSQHGIAVKRLEAISSKVYSVVEALSGIILIFAVLLYIEWHDTGSPNMALTSVGMLLAGATPSVAKAYRLLFPAKERLIIQPQSSKRVRFPLTEVTAWLGIIQVIFGISKEILIWLMK